MEIKCHYFEHHNEDSNMQFECKKRVEESLKEGSAEEVLSRIGEVEFQLQAGFQEYYRELVEKKIKRLRRVIPLRQTKMNWNSTYVELKREIQGLGSDL